MVVVLHCSLYTYWCGLEMFFSLLSILISLFVVLDAKAAAISVSLSYGMALCHVVAIIVHYHGISIEFSDYVIFFREFRL